MKTFLSRFISVYDCLRYSLLLFILFIIIEHICASDEGTTAAPTAVYAYRQIAGTKVDTVFRSVTSSPDGIVITFKDDTNMTSKAICDNNLHIRSWHFECKETGYNVTGERNADTIKITGKKGTTTPFEKSLVIDSLPWYQAMEFSLLSFLTHGGASCNFWILRPTDMKAFKMVATRKNKETVIVNGRSEQAIKVTLSPHGLLGRFWHITYWFNTNDYSFLKSSMPGGSTTITEAIEQRQLLP
jgi:hypothetical protein